MTPLDDLLTWPGHCARILVRPGPNRSLPAADSHYLACPIHWVAISLSDTKPNQLLNCRQQLGGRKWLDEDGAMVWLHKSGALRIGRDVDHRDARDVRLGTHAQRRARGRTGTEMQARHQKIGRGVAGEVTPGLHAIIGYGDLMASRFKRPLYLGKEIPVRLSDEDMHVALDLWFERVAGDGAVKQGLRRSISCPQGATAAGDVIQEAQSFRAQPVYMCRRWGILPNLQHFPPRTRLAGDEGAAGL